MTSAALGQPLCTAMQIALVHLLASWNIEPIVVGGHSSGEIAAAYTCGSLTFKDALTVAYFRGYLANTIYKKAPGLKGAMLAVGLSEAETLAHIAGIAHDVGRVVVACINSESSVTVSGDQAAIDKLQESLESKGVFNRKLQIDTAYHSQHMEIIAEDYHALISGIRPKKGDKDVGFISSVVGRLMDGMELDAKYWVRNMVSQVRFSEALTRLCVLVESDSEDQNKIRSGYAVDTIVEIGPHSALSGPIKQTLKTRQFQNSNIRYASSLTRGANACKALLNLAGFLFADGFPVNITALNFPSGEGGKRVLVDLPSYAWDHSAKFWHESRLSAAYRLRKYPRHHLLGVPAPDSNNLEPRWRNYIRASEIPWVRGHIVQSKMVYPAAGFIAMALEASQQQIQERDGTKRISGYSFRDISISKALIIPDTAEGVETVFCLRPYASSARSSSATWNEFRVFSYLEDEGWSENCRGLVSVEFPTQVNNIERDREIKHKEVFYKERFFGAPNICHITIDPRDVYNTLEAIGIVYHDCFKGIKRISIGPRQCLSIIQIPDTKATMPHLFEYRHIIHPATLDACFQTIIPAYMPAAVPSETIVPRFIEKLYISNDISTEPGAELQALSSATSSGLPHYKVDVLVADARSLDRSPVIIVSGLTAATLVGTSSDLTLDKDLGSVCHQVKWLQDTDFLDSAGVAGLCTAKLPCESAAEKLKSFSASVDQIILEALNCLSDEDSMSQHHKLLYGWMKRHAKAHTTMSPLPGHNFREQSESYGAVGVMLHRIGDQLSAIIKGEVEPLSVMLEDNLLYQVYVDDSFYRCSVQVAEIVSLLAHKWPDMKVLEIGAGTASATIPVLKALGSHEPGSGNSRFSRYDFTDISSGFFEKAEELLKPWGDRIRLKKLDIEIDPVTQGFEEGSYDLIIAANVLHATRTIDNTMTNVRRLLSPGGMLILVEITSYTPYMNVIFGTLPGWWLGKIMR